jgi:hypothetical protein
MRVETIQERESLVLDLVVEKDIPEKLRYQVKRMLIEMPLSILPIGL